MLVNAVFDFVLFNFVSEQALEDEDERLDPRDSRFRRGNHLADLDCVYFLVIAADFEFAGLYAAISAEHGKHVYFLGSDFHSEYPPINK
jgi:hypothetical protein